MNLRTITLWACYAPSRRVILQARRFKKDFKVVPIGTVLVKLTGHYVRPTNSAAKVQK